MTPWGKYPNYRDIARFEYGRLLWKNPEARRRLLAHWESPDHPHVDRFHEDKASSAKSSNPPWAKPNSTPFSASAISACEMPPAKSPPFFGLI